MLRVAVLVLVLAAGALVFEFSVFSIIKANNPWVKALPALVSFAACVAAVFWASKKDAWVTDLARSVMKALLRRPALLYLCAVAAGTAAVVFGLRVRDLSHEREGKFAVQIVRRDDVPEQYVKGMPVTVDHKLRTEVVRRLTDDSGRAEFDVDAADVFAVRIQKSDDPAAGVFVLKSDAQINEKTKRGFQLVRLVDIPEESWIESALTESSAGEFAQIPPSYLRWRGDERAPHMITEAGAVSTFPFTLPDAETVIIRREFTVGFSPLLRLPRWVAYRIVPGETIRRRPDRFVSDPELPERYQASPADYRNNDFDRGHLVRRADLFGLGEASTLKIFYLSAVVPQLSYVNQRMWLALEEYTSAKAMAGNDVYVIRGPIYDSAPGNATVNVTLMGPNRVPVPTHFFQVMYAGKSASSVEAHIVPNAYAPLKNKDVSIFRTSVSAVSEKTGLAFAPSAGAEVTAHASRR